MRIPGRVSATSVRFGIAARVLRVPALQVFRGIAALAAFGGTFAAFGTFAPLGGSGGLLALDPQMTAEPRSDLCLPADPTGGRVVGPWDAVEPPGIQKLVEDTGTEWFVLWDHALGAPRLAYPRAPARLPDAGGITGTGGIAADVAAFIAEHRDFLGVGPEDLAPLEVLPFDDGFHVSALQTHQGIPVRGSAFRMRLNGDRTIRSILPRLARELPAVEPPHLTQDDLDALVEGEGLTEVFSSTLQLAFPAEGGPVAAWGIIGLDQSAEEVEVLFSAVTGERIGSRRTALEFGDRIEAPPAEPAAPPAPEAPEAPEGAAQADGAGGAGDDCPNQAVITGRVTGYSPPPDDPFALATDFSRTRSYPVPGLRILADVYHPSCTHGEIVKTDAEGRFEIHLERIPTDQPYFCLALFSSDRFQIERGLTSVLGQGFSGWGDVTWDLTYNERLEEYASFHLMVYHQMRATIVDAVQQSALQGVAVPRRPVRDLRILLEDGIFVHRYSPSSGSIRLGNDSGSSPTPDGRIRKMVPTIIYHEYGHELIRNLSGDTGSGGAQEGICDAFSVFRANAPFLGYANTGDRVVDPYARNVSLDRTAYPADARTTLAGAFWELWDRTRDGIDPLRPPDPDKASSFAYGLLVRYLGAQHVCGAETCGGLAVEYTPYLGHILAIEADHPRLGGDGDYRTPFENLPQLLESFGRRNLYQQLFIRGDANLDGHIDLSDAVKILGYLFLGDRDTSCPDALDSDDSGTVEITDSILLLAYLFLGGSRLPQPFPRCGVDLTEADGLGCWSTPCRWIGGGY